MKYTCSFCGFMTEVKYPKIIHAGFSNLGFMYCNKCGDVLTWSSFDPIFEKIVGRKHPWSLTSVEKREVENAIIKCKCGGDFTFSAKPRCPNCNNEIPDIVQDEIHFVILKNRIDGENENISIWKQDQNAA